MCLESFNKHKGGMSISEMILKWKLTERQLELEL